MKNGRGLNQVEEQLCQKLAEMYNHIYSKQHLAHELIPPSRAYKVLLSFSQRK